MRPPISKPVILDTNLLFRACAAERGRVAQPDDSAQFNLRSQPNTENEPGPKECRAFIQYLIAQKCTLVIPNAQLKEFTKKATEFRDSGWLTHQNLEILRNLKWFLSTKQIRPEPLHINIHIRQQFADLQKLLQIAQKQAESRNFEERKAALKFIQKNKGPFTAFEPEPIIDYNLSHEPKPPQIDHHLWRTAGLLNAETFTLDHDFNFFNKLNAFRPNSPKPVQILTYGFVETLNLPKKTYEMQHFEQLIGQRPPDFDPEF